MSLSSRKDRDQRRRAVPTALAVVALALTLGAAVLIVLVTGTTDGLVPLASLVAASTAWVGLRRR